jgi:hypothetical protein
MDGGVSSKDGGDERFIMVAERTKSVWGVNPKKNGWNNVENVCVTLKKPVFYIKIRLFG